MNGAFLFYSAAVLLLFGGCALDGFSLSLLQSFIHDLIFTGLVINGASMIEGLFLQLAENSLPDPPTEFNGWERMIKELR